MPQMNTDTAAMQATAAAFDASAGQLRASMASVDAEASGLVPTLQGQTGLAAQDALMRYKEAQQAVITRLDTIGQNIGLGGRDYEGTDVDHAANVRGALGI
jgi:WXG100 family type VII secretion target